MSKYKIHPLAETYPPMSEAEMEALTADIAARGLQRPIVLYEGMILDGRNRYVACGKANVEPAFVEYEGDDPLGQVNSLNLNRDLTAGQRAIIAARQWMLSGDTKGSGRRTATEKTKNFSLKDRCQLHRTNEPSIIHARDLIVEAPDLARQVETCACNLAKAIEKLESRRSEARKQSQDAEKAARFSAEYREAISDGKMTPESAMEDILRREREEREKLRVETEAQQIWLEQLKEVFEWSNKWAVKFKDDHIERYINEDVADTGHHVTAEQINRVIVQLERIRSFIRKEASNGRQKGSKKASASQV